MTFAQTQDTDKRNVGVTMKRARSQLLIVFGAFALVVGCAPSGQSPAPPESTPVLPAPPQGGDNAEGPEGIDATPMDIEGLLGDIENKPLTRDAYEAAFRNFSLCVEKTGSKLIEINTSGDDIRYVSPPGADPGDECYKEHFEPAQFQWQIESNSEDLTDFITPIIECLEDANVAPVVEAPPTNPRDQSLAMFKLRSQANDLIAATDGLIRC